MGRVLREADTCGRATTGCTGTKSIGAPLRLSATMLLLYVLSPTGTSPAATSEASSTWPWRTSGFNADSLRKSSMPLGRDFWAYGYAPNVDAIEKLLRHHHAQGLSRRQLKPHEIFAPETLESYKI